MATPPEPPARYAIVIERRAERELRRLPTSLRQRVTDAIASLANNPRPPGCKKLAARPEAWRIRVGDYRIVYRIDDQVLRVMVIRIGHRSDVYR